jgi:hypothetical protein
MRPAGSDVTGMVVQSRLFISPSAKYDAIMLHPRHPRPTGHLDPKMMRSCSTRVIGGQQDYSQIKRSVAEGAGPARTAA